MCKEEASLGNTGNRRPLGRNLSLKRGGLFYVEDCTRRTEQKKLLSKG